MTTILLPDTLTAANSKELLRNCTRQLRSGALCLDGSNHASMDYSGDAFFALLAELSEKTMETVHLAELRNDSVVYIDKVEFSLVDEAP